MREIGVVTEIKGKTAVVSVDKKAECDGCGLCLFKDGVNKATFYATIENNVQVGDTVEIERSDSGKFSGVLLAFLVPLVLIGLAVALNYLFIKKEIWILILSALFIAVWYVILAGIDKRLKGKNAFNSRIVSIKYPREIADDKKSEQITKE